MKTNGTTEHEEESPRQNRERLTRRASMHLTSPVARVFPLFGPLREKEWAWGWQPEVLYCDSPLVEERMIFRTTGVDGDYTWVVNRFAPNEYRVEYSVHTTNRIWFIDVCCEAKGDSTIATVTYSYTALTEAGRDLNRQALDEMFRHDLKDWQEAIEHYLATGQILRPENATLK